MNCAWLLWAAIMFTSVLAIVIAARGISSSLTLRFGPEFIILRANSCHSSREEIFHWPFRHSVCFLTIRKRKLVD